MAPVLRRLAAETNGVVRRQGPFVMPKLVFSHSGTEVEISSASTGIDGGSIRYTYVLFQGLAPHGFEFRIRPRSLQGVVDEWVGFKTPMAGEVGRLKNRLAIYTNDDRRMKAVLSERIQADLLFWAEAERVNSSYPKIRPRVTHCGSLTFEHVELPHEGRDLPSPSATLAPVNACPLKRGGCARAVPARCPRETHSSSLQPR